MENSIEEDIEILEELRTHGYAMLLMKYEDRIKTNRKIDQAFEHILSDYKRVLKENEELEEKIERQQDIIKNALYIINKNEKEKVDQIWLYNFDKCAILKGDNK